MKYVRYSLLTSLLGLSLTVALGVMPVVAQDFFGDDASTWSNDRICNDPRFIGPGMATPPLFDSDVMHDATDCRREFEAERIALNVAEAARYLINFGDDASIWSLNGECDDRRFAGPGMATTPLLDSDMWHDAADCRREFDAGQLSINFGDDAGTWSNDQECGDPRFSGPGMTATELFEEDILHDATDCREVFIDGLLVFN